MSRGSLEGGGLSPVAHNLTLSPPVLTPCIVYAHVAWAHSARFATFSDALFGRPSTTRRPLFPSSLALTGVFLFSVSLSLSLSRLVELRCHTHASTHCLAWLPRSDWVFYIISVALSWQPTELPSGISPNRLFENLRNTLTHTHTNKHKLTQNNTR